MTSFCLFCISLLCCSRPSRHASCSLHTIIFTIYDTPLRDVIDHSVIRLLFSTIATRLVCCFLGVIFTIQHLVISPCGSSTSDGCSTVYPSAFIFLTARSLDPNLAGRIKGRTPSIKCLNAMPHSSPIIRLNPHVSLCRLSFILMAAVEKAPPTGPQILVSAAAAVVICWRLFFSQRAV